MKKVNKIKSLFCSGYGRSHTNSLKSKSRKPYCKININYVTELMKVPQQCAKSNAQWAIFSSTTNEHARSNQYLKSKGLFCAVWFDIDYTNLDMQELAKKFEKLGYFALLYTTKSATKNNPRYRIIIPLLNSVKHEVYLEIQKYLKSIIQAWKCEVDDCSQSLNQICYLPNRGDYYDYRIIEGELINSAKLGLHQSQTKIVNKPVEKEKITARKAASSKSIKNLLKIDNSYIRTVELFNQYFKTEDLLLRYGYELINEKWLSPLSSSKEAGVIVNKDNSWVSYHESDRKANLGKSRKTGGVVCCFGNAYDLFCFFEFKNNPKTAIKAAGNSIILPNGISLTKYNQLQFYK
ncbi:hypothetical protein [Thiomicrorhabdus sp. Milos-T2]|uniref:hypothetical protein n=1 Tax=Thiomicrorhabdus sp. Milos-T2 TaxID=90814 RepID=UPI00056F888F|nr:hypothetical protein [Thiomicrorhabdus sp. Milos-T2]